MSANSFIFPNLSIILHLSNDNLIDLDQEDKPINESGVLNLSNQNR